MHGGKRPGAGRRKGSTNTKTAIERAAIREKVEAIKAAGETPLEVLLRMMRNSQDEAVVIDCAKAAAPYLHPRLSSVEHKGDPDNPLETVTRIELTAPADCDSPDRIAAQTPVGVFGTS